VVGQPDQPGAVGAEVRPDDARVEGRGDQSLLPVAAGELAREHVLRQLRSTVGLEDGVVAVGLEVVEVDAPDEP